MDTIGQLVGQLSVMKEKHRLPLIGGAVVVWKVVWTCVCGERSKKCEKEIGTEKLRFFFFFFFFPRFLGFVRYSQFMRALFSFLVNHGPERKKEKRGRETKLARC